jgi:hypothetical protein
MRHKLKREIKRKDMKIAAIILRIYSSDICNSQIRIPRKP